MFCQKSFLFSKHNSNFRNEWAKDVLDSGVQDNDFEGERIYNLKGKQFFSSFKNHKMEFFYLAFLTPMALPNNESIFKGKISVEKKKNRLYSFLRSELKEAELKQYIPRFEKKFNDENLKKFFFEKFSLTISKAESEKIPLFSQYEENEEYVANPFDKEEKSQFLYLQNKNLPIGFKTIAELINTLKEDPKEVNHPLVSILVKKKEICEFYATVTRTIENSFYVFQDNKISQSFDDLDSLKKYLDEEKFQDIEAMIFFNN